LRTLVRCIFKVVLFFLFLKHKFFHRWGILKLPSIIPICNSSGHIKDEAQILWEVIF
jgi:hypothetical protein